MQDHVGILRCFKCYEYYHFGKDYTKHSCETAMDNIWMKKSHKRKKNEEWCLKRAFVVIDRKIMIKNYNVMD